MSLNVTVTNQEKAADVLVELTEVKVFDLGCASISIGQHPQHGAVIIVCSASDKSALIPIS